MPSSECIGEEHNLTPYSTEISDIWSLGVIFVNMVTGRNPWRRATTHDQHFHLFMSDPDKFITKMLPMSEPTRELIKRVFTFSPTSRISLEEFREAILAIDTFFPSSEVDSAVRDKRVLDTHASPKKPPVATRPNPETPQLPQGIAQDLNCMHGYPDEEYLFSSPDPDASYTPPSSIPSTPSTAYSPTSTLCGDDDVDVFAKECCNKLGEMALAAQIAGLPHPVKGTNHQMGGALRLLERLVL